MKIQFYKYHGCGNDFILIDNRTLGLKLSPIQINKLCHRRFGIGSDGIILIQNEKGYDYHMLFYNPDGSQSFCGNGSRCALHFSHELGIVKDGSSFLAIDGQHEGRLNGLHTSIHMSDVNEIEVGADYYYLNTGSPHYVKFVDDVDEINMFKEGQKIRYNDRFREVGTNVNYVEISDDKIKSRVYERGVENETYSSGTGTTAVALCTHLHANLNQNEIDIVTKGGGLSVSFEKTGPESFENIWLNGPVTPVFQGVFEL